MNKNKKATQPSRKIAPKAEKVPTKKTAHTSASAPGKKSGLRGNKK